MAGKEKYVAYVSTYTMGNPFGIKIYDVDMEKGRFIEKNQVEITNSSYITISSISTSSSSSRISMSSSHLAR